LKRSLKIGEEEMNSEDRREMEEYSLPSLLHDLSGAEIFKLHPVKEHGSGVARAIQVNNILESVEQAGLEMNVEYSILIVPKTPSHLIQNQVD
jgi:hypothetical protein